MGRPGLNLCAVTESRVEMQGEQPFDKIFGMPGAPQSLNKAREPRMRTRRRSSWQLEYGNGGD